MAGSVRLLAWASPAETCRSYLSISSVGRSGSMLSMAVSTQAFVLAATRLIP